MLGVREAGTYYRLDKRSVRVVILKGRLIPDGLQTIYRQVFKPDKGNFS